MSSVCKQSEEEEGYSWSHWFTFMVLISIIFTHLCMNCNENDISLYHTAGNCKGFEYNGFHNPIWHMHTNCIIRMDRQGTLI